MRLEGVSKWEVGREETGKVEEPNPAGLRGQLLGLWLLL